ncbi:LuxR family transcriptional regulator [Caulobacter sp. CCUG 60055]|uniref:LuxR family transcriptional regulator n=1 Tax=Caulobacter sp. CCUG 60055 TaxID=2100090 RepID=UPI001FA6D5BD|nr:LuxR family transcriptional regulator [Caulobacter sp. CCUG 60055]
MTHPLTNSDVARRAFDAIAQAQRADSFVELNHVLGKRISELGFDTYVGVNVLDPGGRANHQVIFGATHDAWEAHYAANNYSAHDAVLREIISGLDPLFWSDVTSKRPLDIDELRIYNEAAEHGLHEGFMTPIHGLDGSLSAVLLIGEHADSHDPDIRAAAHLMSLYYGSIGTRLRRRDELRTLTPVKLTPRQLECLKWVRHGKSSTDIGDLMGLSSRTVEHYLADACNRLGVRTRAQAVVEASLRGIITL